MTLASGPSLYLSWRELACHDAMRSPYPLDWRTTRGTILGSMFDDVRAECSNEVGHDCPLSVGEGFRTEAYQAYLRSIPRYKAAVNSQHCQGYALDIYCPRLLSFAQFKECVIRAAYREGSHIQYIEYRPSMSYIHIDGGGRPKGKLKQDTID